MAASSNNMKSQKDLIKRSLRFPGRNAARIFKREESEREALQNAIQAKNRKGVPHSALFTLHCASEKSASSKLNLSNDQLLRLWITRILSVITAYYDTNVNVTSITYTDVRTKMREWERENQHTLVKLSALLKNIKNIARQDRKMILSVEEKHKMEIYKASSMEIDVVSDYQKRLWLDRARLEFEEEEDSTDGDDNDDNDDEDSGESMDEDDDDGDPYESEDEPEGQKVRNYLSDTSSEWEREYDSSEDEEDDNGDTKGMKK